MRKIRKSQGKVKVKGERPRPPPVDPAPIFRSLCDASPLNPRGADELFLRTFRRGFIERQGAAGSPPVCVCIACGCDDLHPCDSDLGKPCRWSYLAPLAGIRICSSCFPRDAEAACRLGMAFGRIAKLVLERDPLARRAARRAA